MAWGFERGRTYNRRRDIHDRFDGQRQGGIITPSGNAPIIVITGEEGAAHGYADRTRPDGVFEYFGEGQVGDMTFVRGNRAIQRHVADGRDLLVFRKLRDGLRFEGQFICEAHHNESAPDRNGAIRTAIVFELRPIESVVETTEASAPELVPIDELRARALNAANPAPARNQAVRSVFERSRDVRDYVVARAVGVCESCGTNAPFSRPNGQPYLEPHHIRRLSDGGPDDPKFVIALCPNCHRRAHSSADASEFNGTLLRRMRDLEA